MNRILKNHIVVAEIKSMTHLMSVLHLQKSLYFRPMDRVVPTKFFLGDSWRYSKGVVHHASVGSYLEVKHRDDVMRGKIREKLKDCTLINKNKPVGKA